MTDAYDLCCKLQDIRNVVRAQRDLLDNIEDRLVALGKDIWATEKAGHEKVDES